MSETITWKQRPGGRGVFWGAYRDGRMIGAITWTYIASNNGAAFARNHHPGSVGIHVSVSETEIHYHTLKAISRSEADRLAREYVRIHELKELLVSAYERSLLLEEDDAGPSP